jgi:glycosyltransferase involved in cell wall biosynthesis
MTDTRPLRVTILAGLLNRGAGSHVYNRNLAAQLADRGYEVNVVAFGARESLPESIPLVSVQPRPARPRPLVWRLSYLEQYRRCTRAILRSNLPPCDVAVGAEHLFLRAFRKRFPSVPLVYLPHALHAGEEIRSYRHDAVQERLGVWLYERIQRWALQNADCTLRFTRHACEVLSGFYGGENCRRFDVNPMAVQLPELSAREHAAVPRLLWIGQLIDRKRIDVSLRALAQVVDLSWTFDIVGDGKARPELEALSASLGLQSRVTFHGFQQDPSRYYRGADLLLFPSMLENSPVSMLEAMSYGVPVLAMKHDGVRFHNANGEIITDNHDGFLAGSHEEFAVRLDTLVAEPERLRAVGRAARETIEQRHTWTQHLQRYDRLFEELTRLPAPAGRRNARAAAAVAAS